MMMSPQASADLLKKPAFAMDVIVSSVFTCEFILKLIAFGFISTSQAWSKEFPAPEEEEEVKTEEEAPEEAPPADEEPAADIPTVTYPPAARPTTPPRMRTVPADVKVPSKPNEKMLKHLRSNPDARN